MHWKLIQFVPAVKGDDVECSRFQFLWRAVERTNSRIGADLRTCLGSVINSFARGAGKVSVVLTALLISGCVNQLELGFSTGEARILKQEILEFASADESIDTNILLLDEDIRTLLDERIDPRWHDRKKLNELRELLFHEDQQHITYNAFDTLSASRTFAKKSGNCLSLTSLFVASARHLGLEASYLVVDVEPTWDHQGLTMIRYEHIVAYGRLSSGETYIVDFLPDFIIRELNSELITDEHAISLYLNNLGAELLADGTDDKALVYLARALQIRPDFSDAWNNMGIALRRAGRMLQAEFSFRQAIVLDQANYSALSNLAQFYNQSDDPGKAESFSRRVERYRARNPYFHFFLAKLFLEEGRLVEGRASINESLRLKKEEPDFYLLLARIDKAEGREAQADANMALAVRYQKEKLEAPPREMGHRIWYQNRSSHIKSKL